MGGISFIIVGGTGVGKTTYTKNKLKKVNKNAIYLIDVQNEYPEVINRYTGDDIDEYNSRARRMTNAVIVYEEATIFFSNRSSSDVIRRMLVSKRHDNNTYFFVFHSLRTIPRYLFDLSNYITIFKTNDNEDLVQKRFENNLLTETFLRVKNNPDKHYNETFKIY